MNRTMNIHSAFLIITLLLMCPIYSAVSEEDVKPQDENTLGEGLKAIQEAKGRIGDTAGEENDANEVADTEEKQNDQAAASEQKQLDSTPEQVQNKVDYREENKEVEGLPRGDSLRAAEEPRYDSTGMRDPFKPFIKLVDRPTGPPPIVKPPIRRYPLSSFRLAGIIWIGDEPKAMIVDPETNTYFLGVGDKIGNKDGEIIEVRKRGILVQEQTKLRKRLRRGKDRD